MIADLRFDAEHRAWHMALHARTARALFLMVRVRAHRLADSRMALRADGRVGRLKLRAFLDAGIVRVHMAFHAGHTALQEALALPQAERIGREAARAPVGPVSRVFIDGLIEFQDGHEVVVIIVARLEVGHEDVAERVALRADHRVASGVETRLQHDIAHRSSGLPRCGVVRDVVAARTVAALAVDAEILPRGLVLHLIGVEVFLFLADVARVAVLIPELDFDLAALVRVPDIEVVEPLPPQDVPAGRQNQDAAVGQRGQVVLDTAIAQRVIDAVFDGVAGQVRLADVVNAVAGCERIFLAAQNHLAAREIAADTQFRRGLHHFAVARALPVPLDFGMALRAGRRTGVGGVGRVSDVGGEQQERQDPHPRKVTRARSFMSASSGKAVNAMAYNFAMQPPSHPVRAGSLFASTRWSVILTARDNSGPRGEAAMASLCSTYWRPLYAYVRRQ